MVRMQSSVIAVLGLLVGLLLTVFGWYMAGAVASVMPIPLLTALWYIGLLINWTLAVFVTPFLMITKGRGSWGSAIKGFTYFIGGTFGVLISYYMIPPLLDAITMFDNMEGIIWLFLGILWVMVMLVIPAYTITKEYQPSNE